MKYIVVIIFIFLSSQAFAVPSITGVGGTISNGQTITITGAGFGSNSIVGTTGLEFLGGSGGPIEMGTAGTNFTRTGWSVDTGWSRYITYSTDNVPWGSKVLQMTGSGDGTSIEAPLYYNLPTAVTSSDHLFVSWWQRTTWAGNGQYKILRLSPTQTIVDGDGQDTWFFHNNSGGNTFTRPLYSNSLWPGFSPAEPQATWQRMDLDITTSGAASGIVNFIGYKPGSAVQTSNNTGWQTHYSGLNWNYLVWHNYFGTDGSGNMTAGDVWFKDIYISHGTSSRIELCDSSSWSTRQKCFIQPPTSWSTTSISTQLNQGDMTGMGYLYVVDSTGVSNTTGYAVSLAGTPVINGYCGSDNMRSLSYTPVNLCSVGASSPVAGTGPWNWSCTGSGGGTTASCSASKSAQVTPTLGVHLSYGANGAKPTTSGAGVRWIWQ